MERLVPACPAISTASGARRSLAQSHGQVPPPPRPGARRRWAPGNANLCLALRALGQKPGMLVIDPVFLAALTTKDNHGPILSCPTSDLRWKHMDVCGPAPAETACEDYVTSP